MLISCKYNSLFIRNPKVALSSLEKSLRKIILNDWECFNYTAIPNSNGSVGYRIDFASVPQNRVNELPIGFCRNGSPRFEFYRDAELLPQGYRWHG